MIWKAPTVALVTAALMLAPGAAVPAAAGPHASPVRVDALTVGRTADPLGVDEPQPLLGWTLASPARGQRQSAYQVIVSSSAAAAGRKVGDVWNSGKVASDRSVDVPYAGPATRSSTRYYWRVRIWDGRGRSSAWSRVSSWETGLLDPEREWQAKWIGLPPPADEVTLAPAWWIWYPEGDPEQSAPAATRYFRTTVTVPPGVSVDRALLAVTGDDTVDAWVNGAQVASSSSWRRGRLADVSGVLRPGVNSVALASTNTSVSPAGVVAHLRIEPSQGGPIELVTDGSWKASTAAPGGWQQPGYDDSAWPAARQLTRFGGGPWGDDVTIGSAQPPPYLRREFTAPKPVARARLYVSALGLYEAHLNGRRVGADRLTPGWTDYAKRLQYQTYDVTRLVRRGTNAVGALLAPGWYAGNLGFAGDQVYGKQPWFGAQLRLDYADGTSATVVTDDSWRYAESPLVSADVYLGEHADARRGRPGWDTPGFDDSDWRPVHVNADAHPRLVAQAGPPVRVQRTLRPVALTEPAPGVYVFDLGQNFAGWVRLRTRGPAGTRIQLRHAEVLDEDGTLYTANLRGATATDSFTLAGTGAPETFEPRFTYHGFRYVEVTGHPGRPGLDSLTGVVAHADAPPTGEFHTSDPLVNRLQQNIVWSQRSNFMSVPTDCPQRDERLGWTGDINIFAATATFNMGIDGYLGKFVTDMVDAQSPGGAFTDVAPRVLGGEGTAGWGDAGVVVPWTLWQRYGDLAVVRDHYEAMTKWIAYLESTARPDLVRDRPTYGDWLNVEDDTPQDVVSTAYFAYSTKLVAQMAAALGRTGDAARYRDLFERIKAAFTAAFVSADGRVGSDSQTSYVLALSMGLLPDELRLPAADRLVANIARHGEHLTVGFLGVENLLPVLTETGHLDVAYRLLGQTTFPSWGYQISRGATSVWERWDGIRPNGSFNDPGMNSFNHYGLGSVGDWMYRTIAGINPDPAAPGYRQILLQPRPGGGLTWARGTYRSPYGPIASAWSVAHGTFSYRVSVPVNARATVSVPTSDPDRVRASRDARLVSRGAGVAVYEIGSGDYTFTAPAARPAR